MISLKLLCCSVGISQSCAVIGQHRVPVTFVRTRTLCSVAYQRMWSRHAACRTNTAERHVIRQHGCVRWLSAASAPSEDIMNVFDRKTKRKQRNQTAHLPNYTVYDYLKDEVWYVAILVTLRFEFRVWEFQYQFQVSELNPSLTLIVTVKLTLTATRFGVLTLCECTPDAAICLTSTAIKK